MASSVFGRMLSVGAIRFDSALAERVGQGEVGRCTALADSACQWMYSRRLRHPHMIQIADVAILKAYLGMLCCHINKL